jgi:hypothetical protein
VKLLSWRELFGLKPRVDDLARFLLDAARVGEPTGTYDVSTSRAGRAALRTKVN